MTNSLILINSTAAKLLKHMEKETKKSKYTIKQYITPPHVQPHLDIYMYVHDVYVGNVIHSHFLILKLNLTRKIST